jgi:hypothetical protein
MFHTKKLYWLVRSTRHYKDTMQVRSFIYRLIRCVLVKKKGLLLKWTGRSTPSSSRSYYLLAKKQKHTSTTLKALSMFFPLVGQYLPPNPFYWHRIAHHVLYSGKKNPENKRMMNLTFILEHQAESSPKCYIIEHLSKIKWIHHD